MPPGKQASYCPLELSQDRSNSPVLSPFGTNALLKFRICVIWLRRPRADSMTFAEET